MGHECDDLLRQLADLFSGELAPERSAELHRHLADCPPCMETADFQAQFRQLLAKRCTETVPEEFRARIADLLGGGSPPGPTIS